MSRMYLEVAERQQGIHEGQHARRRGHHAQEERRVEHAHLPKGGDIRAHARFEHISVYTLFVRVISGAPAAFTARAPCPGRVRGREMTIASMPTHEKGRSDRQQESNRKVHSGTSNYSQGTCRSGENQMMDGTRHAPLLGPPHPPRRRGARPRLRGCRQLSRRRAPRTGPCSPATAHAAAPSSRRRSTAGGS